MEAHALLGLEADADERAVKRAYARQLKHTRPDGDPAAFQRLHEAYQDALRHSRMLALEALEDAEAEREALADQAADPALERDAGLPEDAARSGPDTDLPHPAADPDHADADADADADAIRIVYAPSPSGQPSPMPAVSALLDELLQDPDPAPDRAPPSLEPALARHAFDPYAFFDELVERVDAGQNEQLESWLGQHPALYDLADKDRAAWLVRSGVDAREVALNARQATLLAWFFGIDDQAWATRATLRWAVVNEYTGGHYGEATQLPIRQLKRPFRWPRALLYTAIPGMSRRIATLGYRFIDDYGRLPPGVDADQHAFFARLADPGYVGRWRWATLLLRCTLLAVAFSMLGAVSGLAAIDVLELASWTALGSACVGGGVILVRLLQRWSGAPSAHPAMVAVPVLLALAGVAIGTLWPQAELLAYGLLLLACAVHWRRFFTLMRLCLAGMWLGQVAFGDRIEPALMGLAAVPVLLLACDAAYARRRGLPVGAVQDNRWTVVMSYLLFAAGLAAAVIFG